MVDCFADRKGWTERRADSIQAPPSYAAAEVFSLPAYKRIEVQRLGRLIHPESRFAQGALRRDGCDTKLLRRRTRLFCLGLRGHPFTTVSAG